MESQTAFKIVQGCLNPHKRKVTYSNKASLQRCFPPLFISLEIYWHLRYYQQFFSHSRLSPEQASIPFQFSAK